MRPVRANRSPTGRFWREASVLSPDFDGRRSVASFCEALHHRHDGLAQVTERGRLDDGCVIAALFFLSS